MKCVFSSLAPFQTTPLDLRFALTLLSLWRDELTPADAPYLPTACDSSVLPPSLTSRLICSTHPPSTCTVPDLPTSSCGVSTSRCQASATALELSLVSRRGKRRSEGFLFIFPVLIGGRAASCLFLLRCCYLSLSPSSRPCRPEGRE